MHGQVRSELMQRRRLSPEELADRHWSICRCHRSYDLDFVSCEVQRMHHQSNRFKTGIIHGILLESLQGSEDFEAT